jgi:hypothetical protein
MLKLNVRFPVLMDDVTVTALKEIARQRSVSVGSIIRGLVDALLKREHAQKRGARP